MQVGSSKRSGSLGDVQPVEGFWFGAGVGASLPGNGFTCDTCSGGVALSTAYLLQPHHNAELDGSLSGLRAAGRSGAHCSKVRGQT